MEKITIILYSSFYPFILLTFVKRVASILIKMKRIVVVVIINLMLNLNGRGQNLKLSNLLDSLVKEDQKWRAVTRKIWNGEIDTIGIKTANRNARITDSLNFIVVRKIFKQYGYPNIETVGSVGSHNFWLLIQHMDNHPDFQDSVLTKMKIEVDKGNSSSLDYAYLVDRVNVNTKRFQVYGTQMELNKDSTSYEPKPLIDKDNVNERRKSVGLSTIEEYTKVMNERYFGTLKKK